MENKTEIAQTKIRDYKPSVHLVYHIYCSICGEQIGQTEPAERKKVNTFDLEIFLADGKKMNVYGACMCDGCKLSVVNTGNISILPHAPQTKLSSFRDEFNVKQK